jgi:hypothetical protein
MWDYDPVGWSDCNTPWVKDEVVSVVIVKGVSHIGERAFAYCSNLMSVIIPESVTSIGDCAFWGCQSLSCITIPESVKSIGASAFRGCSKLTSVTIPNSVTSIGDGAFFYCSSLESVVLPDKITIVGSQVFSGCSSLCSITIPEGVTNIGECAFNSCTSLITIELPNSISKIDYYAFYDCRSLTDIYYTASEEDWSAVSIDSGNEPLSNATIHYNWGQGDEPDYYTLKTYTTQYDKDGYSEAISYEWGYSLFESDATVYNRDLAIVSAISCGNSYDEDSIKNWYKELGFTNISTLNYPDGLGMAIASQTYEVDGIEKTVIVMSIRGTSSTANILADISDGGAEGFNEGGRIAYQALLTYCTDNGIDLLIGSELDQIRLYINGHSLGGAVAGRLAIELKAHNISAKTFVYTYASAKYSLNWSTLKFLGSDAFATNSTTYAAESFPYVHNIINDGDAVPLIPPLGSRVGNDYYFYNEYSIGIGKDYYLPSSPLRVEGVFGVDFRYHPINEYLARILMIDPSGTGTGVENGIDISKFINGYYRADIHCPVEINVYDEDGNLVGYTDGETAANPESLSVIIVTDGENKYVYVPTDSQYRIEIVGTGAGTMEYSVQEYDEDEQLVGSTSFADVVIEEGKLFESYINGDEAVEDIQLYVMNDGGTAIAEVTAAGEEIPITASLGDVNSDRAVDMKDVAALFQYVSGQGGEIDLTVADTTGDETVDLKDVTRLFQFVNQQIGAL